VELAALAAARATEDDVARLQEMVEARQRLVMQDPAPHLASDYEFRLAAAESAWKSVLYKPYVRHL
jgi:DNA-binding FadR family transcriptional regulator